MRRLFLCAAVAGCSISAQDEVGDQARAVDVTWMNAVGVSTSGNSLTKSSSSTMWDAGAASVETIAGDGYVELTTGESTTAKMAGLSVGDGGAGWQDIDFAIHLKETGLVGVYEAGVLRGGNFTSYAAGDVFRIEVNSGVVRYAKNGTVFYTSGVAPGSPLGVDTSLKTPGATISDVQLVSTAFTWEGAVGVGIDGNNLTKTAPETLWNAGASSASTIDGDGYAEFTTGESTTAKMVGLGNGDDSQHYADIEYAVWLKANGNFGVYEGGVLRASNLGTYAAGDVFRVTVAAGVVRYSRNGQPPFYTSSVPASFPLRVDTSLDTPGATVRDARLVAGLPPCGGPFSISPTNQDLFAECSEMDGDVTTSGDVELPALVLLRGNLTLLNGSLSAPALHEIRGRIFAEAVVTAISLPALVSAYSFKAGRKRTWLSSLDLSSLAFLGGGRGDFVLANPRALVSLQLPSLEAIDGAFTIDGGGAVSAPQTIAAPLLVSTGGSFSISGQEALTSVDFSSLTSVGPSFTIVGNGVLPNCYATELRDQLLAAGWTGTVTISGNDPGGTCP